MTPVQRRPDAVPVGYIRKSQDNSRPEDADKGATQRAAIAAMAERAGLVVHHVESRDWNVSGQRESLDKRAGMAAILAGIAEGRYSALMAYSVDRLARDDAFGLKLRDACEDANVPIHTKLDGAFNFADDETGRDRNAWSDAVKAAANMGRRYNVVNLDNKVEQRAHIIRCTEPGRPHPGKCDYRCAPGEHCKTRHDLGGRKPYGTDPDRPLEDPAAVVAAYIEAKHSASGACAVLNRAGTVPTRLGGDWTQRAILNVLRSAGVTIANVPLPRAGVSAKRTHVFSGLLVCEKGHTLTTHTRRERHTDGTRGPLQVAYRDLQCARSGRTGPTIISERKLIEASIGPAEVALSLWYRDLDPDAVARKADAAAQKRARDRQKVIGGMIGLGMTRAAAEAALGPAVEPVDLGPTIRRRLGVAVDWSKSRAELNADLRTLWYQIKLGPDLLPVRFEESEQGPVS